MNKYDINIALTFNSLGKVIKNNTIVIDKNKKIIGLQTQHISVQPLEILESVR